MGRLGETTPLLVIEENVVAPEGYLGVERGIDILSGHGGSVDEEDVNLHLVTAMKKTRKCVSNL